MGAAAHGRPAQRRVRRARSGSDTYARIYGIVRRIPRGRVATYGQVAQLAGLAHAPRVVGYALHALPPGSGVPWHRVINAQGRVSARAGEPAGSLLQRLSLEAEGVRFDASGRVSLQRYRWAPRRGRSARAGTR